MPSCSAEECWSSSSRRNWGGRYEIVSRETEAGCEWRKKRKGRGRRRPLGLLDFADLTWGRLQTQEKTTKEEKDLDDRSASS